MLAGLDNEGLDRLWTALVRERGLAGSCQLGRAIPAAHAQWLGLGIDWDGNWVSARGRLTIYPSNCSRWKLIARDLGGNAVQSTTSRPCSTADLSTPWFYGDHIQTFLVAYDADGRIVLSLETPQSHT